MGGATAAANASNPSYVALFNNANYAEALMVRWWNCWSPNTITMNWYLAQTNLGGTAITLVNFVPNDTPPPGLMTSGNAAGLSTAGIQLRFLTNANFSWNIPVPFCLVPPGWSLIANGGTANNAFSASMFWEAVKPEQLDEGAWLQANAALLNAQNGQ